VGFGGFEEMGKRSEGEDVGVEVDEGGEDGGEPEEVEFGQCEVEVGAACEVISDGQYFVSWREVDIPIRAKASCPGIPLPIGSTPMTRSNPAFRSSPIVFASTVSGVTRQTILKSRGSGWRVRSEWRRTRAPGR
jgi:hypothetical protein